MSAPQPRPEVPLCNGTLSDEAPTTIGWFISIVESSEDAVISKDLTGKILTWNRGAAAMYGYTAEEMIGQSMHVLLSPDRADEEEAILERIRAGERVQHFETTRVRKNGVPIHVSLTI